MNVNLNAFQPTLNNYSSFQLVVKPIVYLVVGLALALFAAIAFNSLVFGSRSIRAQRIDDDPLLQPLSQETEEREPYSVRYDEGLFKISIMDRLQESSPDRQIKALSRRILTWGIEPLLELKYLADDLDSHISYDNGGPGRQYMTLLFQSLKKLDLDSATSDFYLSKDTTKSFLVPQGEPKPEDFFPGGLEIDNRSDEEIILEIVRMNNNLNIPLFYHIGAVMAYAYFNPRRYLIGSIFHESLFAGILSLKDAEIDAPYDMLSDTTKLKMCKALILSQMRSGEDFNYLLHVLDVLEKGEQAIDVDIASMADFYCMNHLLHAAPGTLDPFLSEDQTKLNMDAIRANKKAFLKSCFDFLLKLPTASLGTIGLTLYPIHTMAKGMMVAARNRWHEIAPPSSSSTDLICSGSGDSEVDRYEAVKRLQYGIQGVLDRKLIVDKITYSDKCNSIIIEKGEWLKKWILRPETSERQLEILLMYWTGSSSVDATKEQSLIITSQQIVYETGTNNIKYNYEPSPVSNSCVSQLELAPIRFEDCGGLSDTFEEGFYNIMDIPTSGLGELRWTLH